MGLCAGAITSAGSDDAYLADRLATYLLVHDSFDDSTFRDHTIFVELNLYPNDVDTLLSLKEKILNLVDTMAQ